MRASPLPVENQGLDSKELAQEFSVWLQRNVQRWGLCVSQSDEASMLAHFEAMLEANARFNVTRITNPGRAAGLHYADSLAVVAWWRDRFERVDAHDEATRSQAEQAMTSLTSGEARSAEAGAVARKDEYVAREEQLECSSVPPGRGGPTSTMIPQRPRIVDVGTGGGFPAVPLAILRPTWRISAIDGTGKKIAFLRKWATKAGLKNLQLEPVRSEAMRNRGRFHLVIARAVGTLDRLIQAARHLVMPGGRLVAYKTPHLKPEELEAATVLATEFGWVREADFDYELIVPRENSKMETVLEPDPSPVAGADAAGALVSEGNTAVVPTGLLAGERNGDGVRASGGVDEGAGVVVPHSINQAKENAAAGADQPWETVPRRLVVFRRESRTTPRNNQT